MNSDNLGFSPSALRKETNKNRIMGRARSYTGEPYAMGLMEKLCQEIERLELEAANAHKKFIMSLSTRAHDLEKPAGAFPTWVRVVALDDLNRIGEHWAKGKL